MYRFTFVFVFFVAGTSSFISLGEDSSEEVNNWLSNVTCNTFTSLIHVWRNIAGSLAEAKVEFYTYYEATDDSEYDSSYSEYDFSLYEDDIEQKINRTTVIIHGYLGNYENEWIESLRNALFHWRKENMSVIVVNWFKSFNYYTAAEAVEEVAEAIYEELKELAEDYDEKSEKRPYLHIMGHSLGAHIAGLTAKMLKEQFNWTVNRVTGFDPAKPFFDIGDDFEKYRLDKSYAKFVDVIHTNSAPNTTTFGLYDNLGHIDFYPNGGDNQPNCTDIRGKSLEPKSKSNLKSIPTCPKSEVHKCLENLGNNVACLVSAFVWEKENMVCDHAEAQNYFTESLKGKKYSAVKLNSPMDYSNTKCRDECCETSVPMGIKASKCRNSTFHGQYNVDIA